MQKKLIHVSMFLFVSLFVVGVVYATSKLTPPGSVANTMYSLTDIYNLGVGTTVPLGTGTIETTPNTIAETGKTLTEVYNTIYGEIDNLSASVIALGTSAFGITGSAIVSLGDAGAENVLAGKYFSNLTTANVLGTMPNNGAVTITPSAVDQAIPIGYHNGSGVVSGDADLVVGNIKSGTNIFGVVGTMFPGGTLKTGQITCWNTAGSAQSPCLDGTNTDGGQDAYYLKGIAFSYTDNLDGTISDNVTGLMWKKCSEGRTYSGGSCTGSNATKTWTQALTACEADTTGGFTDWFLPNVRELISIVDYGRGYPSINPIFLNAAWDYGYQTSNSYTASAGVKKFAYNVSFADGIININDKSSSGTSYVRCVR